MLDELKIRERLIDCYEQWLRSYLRHEEDDYPCSRARDESFLHGRVATYLEVLGKIEDDHFIGDCIKESVFILPHSVKDELKNLSEAKDRATGIINYFWFAKYLPK